LTVEGDKETEVIYNGSRGLIHYAAFSFGDGFLLAKE